MIRVLVQSYFVILCLVSCKFFKDLSGSQASSTVHRERGQATLRIYLSAELSHK